ncbi:MAG: hypothetical protein MJ016_01375 [Victivallaceae bacterium]|nr:hypothetical protein [Victivallaceae bacterium]
MNSSDFRHRDWNEFQWEKAIRRDERRIARYFWELPGCLDLPGEEDLIFEQMRAETDLIPVGCGADSIRNWCYSDLDDDDDERDEDMRRRPGGEECDRVDRLAAEWNLEVCGAAKNPTLMPSLAVACGYAKLLARMIDFVESDPETEKPLMRTLGKRTLADLNELLILLDECADCDNDLDDAVDAHREQLLQVRERILKIIASIGAERKKR